jgi:hypothetical protein
MGTGTGITLIALGAILRFAITGSSFHGLNVHVVGVILMLAGVLGLLFSMLVWGPGTVPPRQRCRRGGAAHRRAPRLPGRATAVMRAQAAARRQPSQDRHGQVRHLAGR